MTKHSHVALALVMLLVAGLSPGMVGCNAPEPPAQDSNLPPSVQILKQHYQPKLKSSFPLPLTVENTEVLLGFPVPNKPATPQEHAAVVQFLNRLCESSNNTRIERYPFSEANFAVKVISKDSTRSEVTFDVLSQGITTSDGEVIIPEPGLMKLIDR